MKITQRLAVLLVGFGVSFGVVSGHLLLKMDALEAKAATLRVKQSQVMDACQAQERICRAQVDDICKH